MRTLLVGCGNNQTRMIRPDGMEAWRGELITLDMDADCRPSLRWDMERLPLPFPDNHFTEIHAYDSIEHWGRQGDWRGWFDECSEYWRLLEPGGLFCAIVPVGPDIFADPGHTRFFSENWFLMLSQKWYETELAKGTRVTDYRWYYKHDFEPKVIEYMGNHHLAAVMQKASA